MQECCVWLLYFLTLPIVLDGYWNKSLSESIKHSRDVWRAQWLSGRVLDSRPRGCGFQPHLHCVLKQDTLILA